MSLYKKNKRAQNVVLANDLCYVGKDFSMALKWLKCLRLV